MDEWADEWMGTYVIVWLGGMGQWAGLRTLNLSASVHGWRLMQCEDATHVGLWLDCSMLQESKRAFENKPHHLKMKVLVKLDSCDNASKHGTDILKMSALAQ